MTGPYATAADIYWQAGWRGILPLPSGAKWPPPKGYTGDAGREPSYPDLHAWTEGPEGRGNIALRLPHGVVGLDVDAYGNKAGAETVRLLEAEHGDLPPTWRTTSRDDGVSGIRLYRVPDGLRWPTEAGPAVEIIRHGHRYAVSWPSIHPEGGTYRWINPHGVVSTTVPDPDTLPELPEAWVAGLTGGEVATPLDKVDVAVKDALAWFVQSEHATADVCPRMARGLEQYDDAVSASTHDAVVKATLRVARLTDEGHHGAINVLGVLRRKFMADATNPERALLGEHRRSETEAESEWGRALASAVGVVLANPSAHPSCDCYGQITGMVTAAASSPVDGANALAPAVDIDPAAELSEPENPALRRMRDGASFILDAPDKVPSVWGDGDECLWAEGEALMIAGPPGVGKTTLTGQVLRGLLGLQDRVLGLPVRPTERRVLYLAMDRPAQIARGLRRAFSESERHILADELRFWEGPPPGDVAKHPDVLLSLAELAEAEVVIIDSVKDAAVGLTEDEVAAAYNRARQNCLAHGVQVLELHHMVKRGAGGNKPTELADVYGSAWLTAGAGSVVLLWGAAGDPIVELRHLKQPAGEVGPWRLVHDHNSGTTSIFHNIDLLMTVAAAGAAGVTAKAAASLIAETDKPSRNDVEKARRKLDKLVEQGHATRQDDVRDAFGGKPQAVYRSNHGAITHPSRETPNHGNHEQSREGQTPRSANHASNHANHASGAITHVPPSREGDVQAPTPTEVETTTCGSCGGETTKAIADGFEGNCHRCAREIGLL